MTSRFIRAALILLSLQFLASAEPQTGATPLAVVQKWITDQNARLPPDLKNYVLKGAPNIDPEITRLLEEYPDFVGLGAVGVAKEYRTDKDSRPLVLESTRHITINGQYLLIAVYVGATSDPGTIIDVYRKSSSRYLRVIHLEAGCNDISAVTLGTLGPVLIKTTHSGCGSGSGGSYYRVSTGGVTESLIWGGWLGESGFVDIDGDGTAEVFNRRAWSSYPDDLNKLLHQIKGYEAPAPGGPWMYETTVYRWKGDSFRTVGKYWSIDEVHARQITALPLSPGRTE